MKNLTGQTAKIKKDQKTITSNDGQEYKIVEAGINDDGNKVLIATKEWEAITDTIFKMPNGKIISLDPLESPFEFYNNNNFEIIFVNNHPNSMRLVCTPQKILIKPYDFGFIPHHYYVVWAEKIGNTLQIPINGVKNMGKMMFIGNKKASRVD